MKYRVIVNGVSFYTTGAAIKRGVGDHSLQNTALQFALDCMGKDIGIARSVHLYDGKMNKSTFDVQISKVPK
jgi:hypothetical protein